MNRLRSQKLLVLALVMLLATLVLGTSSAQGATSVFINEIHYDNSGTDTGEAIEVAGPAGTDLTGWTLVKYNGSNGTVYGTDSLGGVLTDQSNGFGFTVVNYPSNGLQNGSPDGVALVDAANNVVQFLSYEGTFNAVGGPADGMTSTDIGVAESSGTAVGESLQLAGTGSEYEDFTWTGAQANTFGSVNTGQSFAAGPSVPQIVINEIMQNPNAVFDSAGEWFELYNAGNSNVDIDGWTIKDDDIDSHVISNGGPLVVPAGGFLVLGNNADFATNGGATVDYSYNGDWFLSNGADEVVLQDLSGVEVDRVNYDGGTNFPDPTGASMSLSDPALDNNVGENWCTSFTSFGAGDLGTPGAANVCPPPPPPEACGDPFTPIYEVQGSGEASPLVNTNLAVEGVVVGDFQDDGDPVNNELNGFHVQDPTGDGDAATSDGVFVYAPGSPEVNVGDAVRVRGSVSEFNGMTEISADQVWICSSGHSIPPTTLSLPVQDVSDFEAYEGMLVTFPQELVISEYFNFDRFNEIVLTSERHIQPTAIFEPSSPEADQAQADYLLDRITLDDGRTNQNPDPARHPNGLDFDLTNLFRGGDTVQNVTGVIDYSFGLYRIQPTQGATHSNVNVRPAAVDDVGGNLKVAAFNVLNYFTTIDDGSCPYSGGCRGADNATEFTRQRDKIIAAIAAIDADVVGLMEIENHPGDVPTADLVSGLNDVTGTGTYDYVATGATGSDAIRVAMIYKPASVTPAGDPAVLDDATFVDPLNTGIDRNRPAVAQTFMDNDTGGVATVVVNHFKSKSGSELDDSGAICVDGDPSNDVPDCDQGDGQGYFNATRTATAQVLADWLATDPTGSGDPDILIIGDLNSYDKEDPIDVLVANGYSDLLFDKVGEEAYSYLFDGRIGYLDYGMASSSLAGQVTGATAWHINADEADLIDYDTSFKKDAQDAIYAPDAFRASDHDPVVTGQSLNGSPDCSVASPSSDTLWPPRHQFKPIDIVGVTDPEGDPFTITIDSIFQDEPVNNEDDGNTSPDGQGVGTSTAEVRAERDGLGNGRVYHIEFTANDATGSCSGEVLVGVPISQGAGGEAFDDGALFDSTIP